MSRASRVNNEYFLHIDLDADDIDAATVSKYRRTARENSLAFFGSARISSNPQALRFGILRRIFSQNVTTVRSLNPEYKSWVQTPVPELITQGESYSPLTDRQLGRLVEQQDPALLVISALEKIRIADFGDFSHESILEFNPFNQTTPKRVDRIDDLYSTYEKVIQSIHGPKLAKLGETAIAS